MIQSASPKRLRLATWLWVMAFSLAVGGTASAQAPSDEAPSDEALIGALREGGYTIYFRHGATNWRQQDQLRQAGDWTSCDPNRMRQLSDDGRAVVRRIGDAIRALDIPVGKVLSSEYCRAAETARLLNLGQVETTRDIMNTRAADYVGGLDAVVGRARRVLSEPPPPGTNVVVVGHGNLMRAATDAYAGEAGSGIYAPRPRSDEGFELLARLSPEDWMRLAELFAPEG